MKAYRIVVRADLRAALSSPGGLVEPLLTEGMLTKNLAGAFVQELSKDQFGHRVINVRLKRQQDEQALEDIVAVLWKLGFTFVEGTVSEWASEAVERAIVFGLGGGVIGAPSENISVIGLVAAAGAVVGALTGAKVHKLIARHEARWNYQTSRWVLREIAQQQPSAQGLRPGFVAS
jgi:hypothetical protein